jgi:archaemetzincin
MARPREEGFERLGPPRKGEWRSLFREKEQTFDDYVAGGPPRRTDLLTGFCIQPLGSVSERHAATIELLREYAEAFFGLEAAVLEPLPLFEKTHVPVRGQYNSSMILDELAARVPAKALVHLGVTDRDLFARGKKFVFGEGSLERRAAICSVARLETANAALFLRRALKLMTHEAGHTLAIAHCVNRRCVMQGSNTIEESDGHPFHLCPEDLRKLEWSSGVARAGRARKLHAFYVKVGLTEEAEWVAATRKSR